MQTNTQKITQEILATGMTQAELAKEVGCTQGLISAYVLGNRGKTPKYTTYARLLEIYAERVKGNS